MPMQHICLQATCQGTRRQQCRDISKAEPSRHPDPSDAKRQFRRDLAQSSGRSVTAGEFVGNDANRATSGDLRTRKIDDVAEQAADWRTQAV